MKIPGTNILLYSQSSQTRGKTICCTPSALSQANENQCDGKAKENPTHPPSQYPVHVHCGPPHSVMTTLALASWRSSLQEACEVSFWLL
jgi:hypothetical protein